jgi:hypothetical protein
MNGLNGASMSFLNSITEGEIDPKHELDFKPPQFVEKSTSPAFVPLFPEKGENLSLGWTFCL